MYDRNILKCKWLHNVKSILDYCGYSNMWYEMYINVKWLKTTLYQKLEDLAIQRWFAEVNDNRNCTIYRIIKATFGFEKYLTISDPKQRNNICKFRTTNHKLPIVTGRFNNVERAHRLCNLCDEMELGDEFHYLFNCTHFINERALYIKPYYRIRPNTLKLCQLFSSRNSIVRRNLSIYIAA